MKIKTSLLVFTFLILLGTNFSQNQSVPKLILLVDQSGSLKTNDPLDLRKDALKFLIEQNNSWDKVAIYSFGSDVKTHYPNAGSIFYKLPKDRGKLINVVNSLSRNDSLTDLKKGLSKVYDDLTRSNSWDNTHILIFTDAQLKYGDIPHGITVNDYLLGLYDIAKAFAAKNVIIDGVAFTKNADISYLQTLSSLTNGYSLRAFSPETINQTIAKLISKNLKGPLTSNREIEINVSSLVSSFTIFAFNNRMEDVLPTIILKDPQDNIDNDNTKSTYKTSVTLEKDNPKKGIWKAIVKGAKDVKVYYGKKINYELIINKPKAKDLSLSRNSIIPFDIEVKSKKLENLLGTRCEVFLEDSVGNTLKNITLQKNGSKFTGNFIVDVTKGTYALKVKLSKNKDFIEKKFTVKVEEGINLDYKLSYDIVVENPILVSVFKPSEEKSKIELNIKTPQNETIKEELFDDGLAEHGDNLANDGIFSARIDNLTDAGVYEFEFSLSYEKEGIPVVSKHVEKIYKAVSIDPEIVDVDYPNDTTWKQIKEMKIINLTSYKINLKEILPDSRYTDKIKISLESPDIIILPREEKKISISVSGLASISGEHKLINSIYCDLIDPQREENKISNAKINLVVELKPESPISYKALIIAASIVILLVLLSTVGLLIITPLRFKNVIYSGIGQEIGISYFRKFPYPYVDLEDIGRIGISLLGYGYWYFRDEENKVAKFYNNINLRKENL